MLDGATASSAGQSTTVRSGNAETVLTALETLSMLLAMQGLFMMYRAGHEALAHYRPTIKFIAIKLMIIVATFQRFIVRFFVHHDAENPPTPPKYDYEARCALWNSFFICMWSTILAVFMYNAFPAAELLNYHKENGEQANDKKDSGESAGVTQAEAPGVGEPIPLDSIHQRAQAEEP